MKKSTIIFVMTGLLSFMPMIFAGEHQLILKQESDKTWSLLHKNPMMRLPRLIANVGPNRAGTAAGLLLDIKEYLAQQKPNDPHISCPPPQVKVALDKEKLTTQIQDRDTLKKNISENYLLKNLLTGIANDNVKEVNLVCGLETIAILQIEECKSMSIHEDDIPTVINYGIPGSTTTGLDLHQNLSSKQDNKLPAARNFTQYIPSKKAIGFFGLAMLTSISFLYAVSKLEYWNSQLAPSLETHLSSFCNSLTDALPENLMKYVQKIGRFRA